MIPENHVAYAAFNTEFQIDSSRNGVDSGGVPRPLRALGPRLGPPRPPQRARLGGAAALARVGQLFLSPRLRVSPAGALLSDLEHARCADASPLLSGTYCSSLSVSTS